MRLFHDNARTQLSILAECLARDPSSLQGWFCLHLHGIIDTQDVLIREAVFSRLEREMAELEGTILSCADGDLFIIHRGEGIDEQMRLAEVVGNAVGHPPCALTTYAMRPESGTLRDIFLDKVRNTPPDMDADSALPAGASLATAEIREMRRVLRDAKATRYYRTPMQVLLVEDDDLTRRVAGNVLKANHVLIQAANAYEAVVNYLLYAPEIVFLDIDLPDMNGFSVLEQITACDPDAYVVMFSGNDTLDNVVQALSRGAHGFVAKPFQKSRLQHYLSDRELAQSKQRGEVHG